MDHGVLEEDIYRFKAEKGNCKSCEIKSRRLKVTGYVKLQRDDESTILKAIKQQPIIAIMTVFKDLKPLKKDVYQGPGKDQKDGSAHGMLIVGYGIENGVPYYLVKSSWGTQWGIGGYGKIARKLFRCFMYPE